MGRAPGSKSASSGLIKKGPWTADEDLKLKEYIAKHGASNWRTLPQNAGLQRCGKSCRLRWTNYLRPDIKRGRFSFEEEEEEAIIQLHSVLGNKWSAIAARLPGRTDNEIKNYWNTHIRKRLLRMGLDPVTHSLRLDHLLGSSTQLNNLSNMFFLLNQQQQQQPQMVNPQLLNIVTTLLSLNQEQRELMQVQKHNNNVPIMQDDQLFQSHASTFLQSNNNNNGSSEMMTLHGLVDDMGARTSSSGSLNNMSNKLVSDSTTTPFTSYTSSPLESSYTSNGMSVEDEIDSFLNFEIPEGFDLNELLN